MHKKVYNSKNIIMFIVYQCNFLGATKKTLLFFSNYWQLLIDRFTGTTVEFVIQLIPIHNPGVMLQLSAALENVESSHIN